jgi:gamma-glutamyltranspeptidase/glutathione hydrolase
LKADLFRPVNGKVPGARNEVGWLAAGVPGILAGLQLLLDRFGTRPLSELMLPAIRLCREGFAWPAALAATVKGGAGQFGGDQGSRQLYFRNDQPIQAGMLFQNPELAELLEALAKANSVAAFYQGDIAQRIAEAFQTNGGLVTAADLAAYKARFVSPLTLAWGDQTIHTAPLTAGGLTVLQALRILQALKWSQQAPGLARTHARLEALRLAWRDRLTLLGDPERAEVSTARLLSEDYARESAEQIAVAVKAGRLLSHTVEPRDQDGTINLSAADRAGNFVALTLTHGNAFGARVTVPGLGLTLGHGMSRFDPVPDHPNAPGPGKRPLHNMAPTIVVRRGQGVLAIGGRGGRKIPNALFEALTQYVVLDKSLAESIAAPRLHTEGSAELEVEALWPTDERDTLQAIGYRIRTAGSAALSAVALEQGQLQTAIR